LNQGIKNETLHTGYPPKRMEIKMLNYYLSIVTSDDLYLEGPCRSTLESAHEDAIKWMEENNTLKISSEDSNGEIISVYEYDEKNGEWVRDETKGVFGRHTENGNVQILHSSCGAKLDKLKITGFGYWEFPIIISEEQAIKIGIEIED